ncbi:MAG: hypothetical protein PHQ81_11660 [Methanofollis sp.]|nr:hypothetical protein [Methanofollis sp.]
MQTEKKEDPSTTPYQSREHDGFLRNNGVKGKKGSHLSLLLFDEDADLGALVGVSPITSTGRKMMLPPLPSTAMLEGVPV